MKEGTDFLVTFMCALLIVMLLARDMLLALQAGTPGSCIAKKASGQSKSRKTCFKIRKKQGQATHVEAFKCLQMPCKVTLFTSAHQASGPLLFHYLAVFSFLSISPPRA